MAAHNKSEWYSIVHTAYTQHVQNTRKSSLRHGSSTVPFSLEGAVAGEFGLDLVQFDLSLVPLVLDLLFLSLTLSPASLQTSAGLQLHVQLLFGQHRVTEPAENLDRGMQSRGQTT